MFWSCDCDVKSTQTKTATLLPTYNPKVTGCYDDPAVIPHAPDSARDSTLQMRNTFTMIHSEKELLENIHSESLFIQQHHKRPLFKHLCKSYT